MKTHVVLFAFSAIVIAAAGCAPIYQVTKPDPVTGELPTNVEVKPEEIRAYKVSDKLADIQFVLLRTGTGGGHTADFDKFIRESLDVFGIKKIVGSNELAKMVLSSSLRDSVGNVTDPVALARISEEIGPFLIIDVVQVFLSHGWFETRLRITDPEQVDVLLEIHRVRLNWANLDREVNYPVLNVLKKWIDESRRGS